MRIAFKIKTAAILLGTLAIGSISSQFALAADPTPTFVAPTPASVPAPAQVAAAAPAQLPVPATPKTAIPAPGANGTLNSLESKIPDSVKDIVKHLDKTTEDVTLDDLNTARQAVAKIEALIEIEKHLAELEKVRDEREKKSFIGAIPASALQPPMPSSMASTGVGSSAPPQMMMAAERTTELTRVVGRNGHYSAVLKMSDDKTRTVQVGDFLPDGARVISITTTAVETMRGNVHQSFHVKNVDTVYGSSF